MNQQTDLNIKNFDGFENIKAYVVYRDIPFQYFFAKRSYVGYADKKNKGITLLVIR